jgi:hypothetical protein
MLCFERRGFLAMIAARLMPRPRRGPSTSPVLPDRGTCVRCTAPGCGPTHVPCSQRIGWGRSHILITRSIDRGRCGDGRGVARRLRTPLPAPHDQLIVPARLPRCVGRDLGRGDRHRPGTHQSGARAQRQDLAEQAAQPRLVVDHEAATVE